MRTNEECVSDYMEGVLSGKITAGKYVKLAVQRHLDDLEHAEERGFRFDSDAANSAIDFCRIMQHTTGEYANTQFELRDWQKFIFWVLFGWVRLDDGMRRFRWAYISVARGNGKSPLAAAVANYLFIADMPIEPRAQVYSFATKEQQAKIVFEEARKQLESVPGFEFVERHRNTMCILRRPWNGSTFEPKGSDSKKSDGWILHGGVIDELLEWHDNQRGLLEKIETSMAKRRQPLVVIITTAGDDDSEVWEENYHFYKAILEKVVESDRHFAFIAEVDKDEDVLDPEVWPQANPMLNEPDSPVKVDEMASLAAKAQVVPSALNTFKRYYANQQVASFYQLLTPELWAMGNGELPDLNGLRCHAGFDWGWRDDLAALALVFPVDGKFYLRCWAWIPEDGPRNLQEEPFASFIQNGEVIVTPGDTTDIYAIHKKMSTVVERYAVSTLAGDPNNCREFLTKCENEWGIETTSFPQTVKHYNEPTRGFVEELRQGNVVHGNSPLLRWCADNVSVREDANEYIMPHKVKSKDKIDPIVAVLMGFSDSQFAEDGYLDASSAMF